MLRPSLAYGRVRKEGGNVTPESKASITRSAVINTQSLSKIYNPGKASEVAALKLLDIEVPGNAIFGFLGPNGAGRSTTIKLLLGLTRRTGGSATLFGHDIVRESLENRERIAYLAEDLRFYDHMTARAMLRVGARQC